MRCPDCEQDVPVLDGLDADDALWLHARRCTQEALFPEVSVVCTTCDGALLVGPDLSPIETLWLHDHDCSEALFGALVDVG
jgi:hypothetical protein